MMEASVRILPSQLGVYRRILLAAGLNPVQSVDPKASAANPTILLTVTVADLHTFNQLCANAQYELRNGRPRPA